MGLFKRKQKDAECDPDCDSQKSKEKEEEEDVPKASIGQLFRYTTGKDKLMLLVGTIVAMGTGVGMPLLSIIMGNISQNFIESMAEMENPLFQTDPHFKKAVYDNMTDAVVQNCLEYTYLGIGVFAAASIQALCFLWVCENLVNRLRREFLKAILRQDITWFDKNHSGTLATKLFDNLERVKEGTGDKLGLMVQFVAQFFGGFIVAFTYNWLLTLIMMSLAPFLIICGAFIAKLMASAATQEAKKYALAGAIAEEVLTCMRTVIAFNGQQYECDRYDEALNAGKATGIKKSIYIGVGLGMTFLIMFSSYCLAFWVGVDFVYSGKIPDGGTVMTVFFSVMMGSMALGQAGPQFAVLGTAMGAAGALYQIIDREPEIDAYSDEGERPKDLKGKVTVKNLHFTYPSRPDVPILKGLSFEASPGQTVALVGSSGCGKSTIIQLLLRYYNPESGSIAIDGIEIRDINIEFLRNYIGVVSQEPNLFNTTIEQNIRYGRWDVTEQEIIAALHKANAYNFVMGFPDKLKTLVGDRGAQMSGGQKQRIAIARALVRDPKILLLDEATSALDAESEHVVQQALDNASKGRTTIVIAHRLSTIRNADKIIVMKAGEVMEVGTHVDLLEKKGLYHELVNAQVFADVATEDEGEKEAKALRRGSAISTGRRDSQKDIKRLKSQVSASPDKKTAEELNDPQKDLERLKAELEEEGAAKSNLFGILKYARAEWTFLAIAVISSSIQGCVFPAFSLFFSQIIKVFSNPDREKMKDDGHFWALMFLVLGGVECVTMLTQCFFFGLSAERLTMRLRSKVFRNVMRMDAPYFDMPRHSPGKISTRLATDAPNVKSAIDYRLGSVFGCFVSIGCGIGIAFYYGWQMALLVIAIFPLAGVGQSIQMKYFSGKANANAQDMENSGKVALEAIENIRTVQALTLQRNLYDQFCHYLDKPHITNKRRSFIQGLSYGFASSIFYFLYAASFRFGMFLITDEHVHMDPMSVLRVLFAISFTAGSLGFASAYFPEYIKATFAAGLIFKMLDEEPGIDSMTPGGKRPKLSGYVKLNSVHFRYPERPDIPILQGLDVDVKPGETLALVGPSGCGKSTVISLLERFYDPAGGAVTVDGEDLREMNPNHLRSHIALVSQEPILFDTSIRANIVYGLPEGSVSEDQILQAAQKANIHKFVSELPDGYNTRVGDKGTQLSGGQKQRIAIARALIRNPRILLLDEATSALDTESEKLVQEALDKASEGRTCIVVAHRLSTVVNASCIMVVTNGKVVEKGTHDQLMQARGAYFALTQKQSMGVVVENHDNDDDIGEKF